MTKITAASTFFTHCFSRFFFYRNKNKRLSDSKSMCVFPEKFIMSTCTNIVNGTYIREIYNNNSLIGSEIWNFSHSLRFWVCFQPIQIALLIIKCMCWSQLFHPLQMIFASWSNNYLDFHTLLLVFNNIIVYDIIKIFLCRWKIKLFKNEIKPQN